jgi:hypothetical protein
MNRSRPPQRGHGMVDIRGLLNIQALNGDA